MQADGSDLVRALAINMRGRDWTSGNPVMDPRTDITLETSDVWCSGNGNDPLSAIASWMQRDACWLVGFDVLQTPFFVWILNIQKFKVVPTIWQRLFAFPCLSRFSDSLSREALSALRKGSVGAGPSSYQSILNAKAWPLFANMI